MKNKMTIEIDKALAELLSYEDKLTDKGMEMLTPGEFFPVDMYATGVINRSLSLISGFATLIETSNYIGAIHLVRPHLDNYLRFSAVWLVSEPHDFAKRVMDGEQVDKIKDRKGIFLRDSYLVSEASKSDSWIESVYRESSGLIHLSKKHIFSSGRLKDKDSRTVEFKFSKEDKYVPDLAKVEALKCMIAITDLIIHLLTGWIATKKLTEEELFNLRKNSDDVKVEQR